MTEMEGRSLVVTSVSVMHCNLRKGWLVLGWYGVSIGDCSFPRRLPQKSDGKISHVLRFHILLGHKSDQDTELG